MKSVLIYTVHKAASMFLEKLALDVADEFGICHYSMSNEKYYDKIKQLSWKTFIEEKSRPGCFGPIRAKERETIFPEALFEYSIILHLRDPRDVLTSLFFSYIYSHPTKEGRFNPGDALRKKWEEWGIDNFVLVNLPYFKERYQLLTSTLLDNTDVKLIKYEDMISNYPKWLYDFLSAFSHLDVPSQQIPEHISLSNSIPTIHQKLFEKYKNEFTFPTSEDVYRHKRQIKPGDHKNKLKPATIEILNDVFSDVLELLSYK